MDNLSNIIRPWAIPGTGYLVWDKGGQLTIEFNAKGSVAEALFNSPDNPHDALERIQARMRDIFKGHRDDLEKAGIRVFDIRRHNDFSSVEADYGAPAQGLDFFASLIDPVRAFRYEPVHYVEGVYKTHVEQARRIGVRQKENGYRIFDNLAEDQYPSQIHFTNGGVTRAFSDLVETVADRRDRLRKDMALFGRAQGAAMIVPVPTYGLFLYRMQEILDGRGIGIRTVRRNEDGSVNEASLRSALRECAADNIRVLSYYDCNPHNPTGHVRRREETERIAEILVGESERYIEDDLDFLKTLDHAAIRRDPQRRQAIGRWIETLSEVYGGIVIIDDMAYEGLELSDDCVPCSFGQVSYEAAQRTAVLKGVSKIGLPGIRAGLVIAHSGVIAPLARLQLTREFCANSLGVDILAARYGGSADQEEKFKAHADTLRRLHRYKAGIVEAFFNGLDDTVRLDADQKERLIRDYAAHAGVDPVQAESRLKAGLTPFGVPESMECGFFYRVNCEALRGRAIAVQFEEETPVSTGRIHTGPGLNAVFRGFGIHVVPASGQGCPEETLSVRITTSLPDRELFRFYDNMRSMRAYFFGDSPASQLDLFRRNPVLGASP